MKKKVKKVSYEEAVENAVKSNGLLVTKDVFASAVKKVYNVKIKPMGYEHEAYGIELQEVAVGGRCPICPFVLPIFWMPYKDSLGLINVFGTSIISKDESKTAEQQIYEALKLFKENRNLELWREYEED